LDSYSSVIEGVVPDNMAYHSRRLHTSVHLLFVCLCTGGGSRDTDIKW